MQNQDLYERSRQVFTPNYAPPPLVVDRGEGMYLFDVEGNRYLDMVSGIAVSALGHKHPKLIAALQEQLQKVLHTSNLYLNEPSIRLAEYLVEHTFGQRVFLCNSGAEAVEAAIKLARRYAHDQGHKERNRIISFAGSFHGRTFAALSATAQPKYHEGFGPMPEGFDYLPLGDLDALQASLSERTAAVMIEPVQGEGGVHVPGASFLQACRRLCNDAGALLIFDEVQAGMGRTGHLFAHQGLDVNPDIMTVAKGIGAGLPLGGIVASEKVGQSLIRGTHGSTYGGNPLACAAANVVFQELLESDLMDHVVRMGDRLRTGLRRAGERHGMFADVRGRGLMVGAELVSGASCTAKDLVNACREHNVLIHVAGPNVLRFLPPLVAQAEHIDKTVDVVDRVLGAHA